MKRAKYVLGLILTLIFVACAPHDPPGDGLPPVDVGHGINGKWAPGSFPLYIRVPSDFDRFWPQIQEVENDYNQALGLPVLSFYRMPELSPQFPDLLQAHNNLNLNLYLYYQNTSWYSSNYNIVNPTSVLAFTSYSSRQNHYFVRGIIVFNFYQFSPVNVSAGQNGYDFASILRHEIGHLLGLGHVSTSEDPNSAMNPYSTWNQAKPLSAKDIARLRSLYGL
jgi:hypothetical protein